WLSSICPPGRLSDAILRLPEYHKKRRVPRPPFGRNSPMTRWLLQRLLLPLGLGALGAWLLAAPPRGGAFAPAPVRQDWGKGFKNSLSMKLMRIPPGRFKMGSPNTEAGRKPDEGPQHEVEITQPFYLGAFEVTQAEFQKVTGKNPSNFSTTGA